jgi:hypothetical protein
MLAHADGYEDVLQHGAAPLQLRAAPEAAGMEPIVGEVAEAVEASPDDIAADAALAVEVAEAAEAAATAAEFYPAVSDDRSGEDGLDQFSQTEEAPRTPPAMPQRKSASRAALDAQAPTARIIEGVTFPAIIQAGEDDERPRLDDITQMTDEADRLGVGLTSFSQQLLGLKPQQITREAGRCLLKAMQNRTGK